jgi:spoIIIJ-associated protein
MASPDRKAIHDVLSTEEGVTTASQGEDPNRRVIVSPS